MNVQEDENNTNENLIDMIDQSDIQDVMVDGQQRQEQKVDYLVHLDLLMKNVI